MKVTLILADSAQVADGKIYIMGGGWSVTDHKLLQSAIAGKIEVPWEETDKKHTLKLELFKSDSTPHLVKTPKGDLPLIIGGEFSVGKPTSLPKGTPSDVPFAFAVRALELEPGNKYRWKLSIDDKTREDWWVDFYTRQSPISVQAK